jgi:hypothetical protein
MGWYRVTGELWTRNTVQDITTTEAEIEDPTIFKLAICCANK